MEREDNPIHRELAYKLLALDMDGTLLNEEKRITPFTRDWIHRAVAAGVTVMFSTGRGKMRALPYAEELQLSAPLVAVNGSEVWLTPDTLLEQHPMELSWIRRLRAMAQAYDVWYWAYATDDVYNRENWPSTTEQEEEKIWLKFGFYTENPEKLPAIRAEVTSWNLFEVTNSHPCNLELNPIGVSKASGLQRLCEAMGIRMEQVIAVGDSMNDAAMIQAAGLGVAMGNAQAEVKAMADTVTSTNEEDGVAEVIWRHIFGLHSLVEAERVVGLSTAPSVGSSASDHEQDVRRKAGGEVQEA